jgi:hypothetical protein
MGACNRGRKLEKQTNFSSRLFSQAALPSK